MTTFAYAMAAALEAANDDLEGLIDRITYNRPHLRLEKSPWIAQGIDERGRYRVVDNTREYSFHDSPVDARKALASFTRPWKIVDAANDDVLVAEFPSVEWAERFARAHQLQHGSTLDYESFRADWRAE